MEQDKKVSRGRMTFVLARGIGQAFLSRDVAEADVIGLLEGELAA
jgi:3-dehydroquinate synthetase